jgi:hypothetical protein
MRSWPLRTIRARAGHELVAMDLASMGVGRGSEVCVHPFEARDR